MKLEIWLGIVLSAILAFGVAIFYKQPVHWFLFIIILFIGLFINTIILILKVQDENT
ncbi:hypothetical protein [Solibacillus sp. FSL K6-1523]|uniref:hypothetical protein n=1 Tax=Solibacillus sp. FSL K6-1523 TaxID=2921471 RepID=UPI0030FB33DA